mgnify:CR=1 FL=1
MRRRWKYSDFAKKQRYCQDCGRRLKCDESTLCGDCLIDLLLEAIGEDTVAKETPIPEEDEE